MFESGNLQRAELNENNEYLLYMTVDTNTRGHQQWFFFSARNGGKGQKYHFKIRNFTKSHTLFGSSTKGESMKVCIMSKRESELNGAETWR